MRDLIDSLARTPLSKVVIFVLVLTVIRLAVFPMLMKTPAHKRTGAFGGAKILNELLDAFVYAGVFVFMLIRPFGVQAFLIPSGSMWPTLYVNDFIVANKAIYRYTDPKPNDVVVFRPPVAATWGHADQLDEEKNVKVDFIKRCIGTPGDVIELRKGVLYRNGKPDPIDTEHKNYSVCVDDPPPGPGQECQQFQSLTDAEKEALTKASFKLVNYKGKIIPLNYTETDANSASPAGKYGERDAPYVVAPEFRITNQDEARGLEELPAEPIPKGMYLMMGDNRNGSFDSRGWGLVPRESIIGRAEFIWFPLSRMSGIK